jgi:hypothetical protein
MSQIKTKYLQDDAVNESKFKLSNDGPLRARNNADSADVNLLKLDTSDVLQFLSHPQISTSASNADDVLTKKDQDAALEGLKPKEAVRATSHLAGNITLSGTQSIDGVSLVADDRVLVNNQTASEDNGIYVVAAGAWSRASDMDSLSPIDEINGASVSVREGTLYQGWNFVQYGTVATLGTDAINFTYRSNLDITGGDGIDITSNTISVDHDGEGLTISSNQLALELDGSTLSKSASGVKVADNGITETQLDSSVDAESFQIATGYSPSSGNVTVGDTIQAAIQRVEAKADAASATGFASEDFTLSAGDITNQYVDLASTPTAGSIHFLPEDGPAQKEGTDFTVSTNRITFAGDLATGGDAALVEGEVIQIKYATTS